MLNLLIANNNVDYARSLMSSINATSNYIRVSNITVDGKETLELLSSANNIDIVLLDLKMPNYDGIEILNRLVSEHQNQYNNSILVTCGEMDLISNPVLKDNSMIYKLLPNTLNTEQIVSQINELILIKEEKYKIHNIKSLITDELLYLSYDVSHKGTQYLIDVIYMIFSQGDALLENLNKYVYPTIAQRYNQTSNNIKCNIVRATEAMYYNCPEDKLTNYFSLTTPHKPNIKTIISIVLLNVHKNIIRSFYV